VSLKTLRVRVDHLWIAAGAVFLVIGSVFAWRALAPEEVDPDVELDAGLERMRSKSHKSGSSNPSPKFVRPLLHTGNAYESSDQRVGWNEPQTPNIGDPGQLGPDEAVDEFKAVVAELEAAVEDGRRLSKREQDELYNRATGSFTALSSWVDASNSSERALMDDAYAQMMTLMRQLDFKPPEHHPDGALVRR
jgi:hypothetical protein